MSRFFRNTLVLASLLWSFNASATCPSPLGEISVFPGQIAPFLDDSVSASDITYAAQQVRPGLADGVTLMTFDYRVELQSEVREGQCPQLDVQIYLFAKKPVIYVAKELPRSSCRWKAVMEHELLHVQIAQRALDFAASELQRQVLITPRFSGSLTSLSRKNSDMQRWVQSLAAQATATVVKHYEVGNAQLDTAEEGTRLEAMCNESLRSFLSLKR